MKFKSVLFAGGVCLFATASYANDLSPRQVVKKVGKALLRNDQATVMQYLTGNALALYSGPSTLSSLSQELHGFKDFDVKKKEYMGESGGMSSFKVRVEAERPGSGTDIQLFDVYVLCVGHRDDFPDSMDQDLAYDQSYDQSYGQSYDQQSNKREDDKCKISDATALYAFAAFGGGQASDQGYTQDQNQGQSQDLGQSQDQGNAQDQGQSQDLGQSQQGQSQDLGQSQQGQY